MMEVPPTERGSTGHRRQSGWRAIIGALVAVVVIVGGLVLVFSHPFSASGAVHGDGLATGTPPAVGTGYLTSGNGDVIFLQWNKNGSFVSGSGQDVALSGQTPNMTTESNTFSVTGTINGGSVTLSFSGWFTAPPQFGQLRGGRLTINVPQQSGGLAPLTFRTASVNDFNAAVSNLQQRAGQANQAAISAAQAQQRQQEAQQRQQERAAQIQKQQQAIDHDISTVNQDLSNLAQSSATDGLQAMTDALAQEKAQLQKTAQAEQAVLAEAKAHPDGNNGNVCYDASNVDYDASNVSYDASNVSFHTGTVASDISGLRNGTSGLQSDFNQLKAEEAILPSYTPQPTSQGDVSSAVVQATEGLS
jgi:hypothetical protein